MIDLMYVNIKVIPNAHKTELVEKVVGPEHEEVWKIKVAAPPEKGKANKELCRFLAEYFEVPKSAVTVSQGHTSQRKVVRVEV